MDLEQMATMLTDSGDYRVLRRIRPQQHYATGAPNGVLRQALLVDVETTGLDTAHDAIIEFGAVPFRFDSTGAVFDVLEPVSWFEDPGRPIPQEIQSLTGITDDMVRGQRIDEARIAALLADSVLVIAHNARFDRQVIERRLPGFAEKHWGCSCEDIPWPHFDGQTRKLNLLLHTVAGVFHDGHRAVDDCIATVYLLAQPQDAAGKTPMSFLLDAARRKTHRVWAIRSPFETKEALKARGYRWVGERKTWYIDCAPDDVEAERVWLRESVYGGSNPLPIEVVTFSAKERYSLRGEPLVTWPS